MTLLSDGFFGFMQNIYKIFVKVKKFVSIYIIILIELHRIIMLQNLCFETKRKCDNY